MVVEVDLTGWREERVSQFSRDAVETMVQVRLQTVRVVDGVEACQERERERHIPQSRGGKPSLPLFLLRVDYSGGDDGLLKAELFFFSLHPPG